MTGTVGIDGSDPLPPARQPDAHGRAALMLAESMLHALVERGLVSTADAVAMVRTAQEVLEEVGAESDETRDTIARSSHLLGAIATSLEADLNGDR